MSAMDKHSNMNKNNVKNNTAIRTEYWMEENCLQCLQQKSAWKL